MRGFFGFIELLLGFVLLFSLIGAGVFFYLFNDNLTSNFISFYNNTEELNKPVVYLSLLNMGIMSAGFFVLFFILSIILIINGILDLRSE